MNILADLPIKDRIVIEQQLPKTKRNIGSMIIKRGHSLFKCNIHTFEVTKQELEKSVVVDTTQKSGYKKSSKVKYDDSFIYVGALNIDNAKKKFRIMLIEYLKFLNSKVDTNESNDK